MDTSEPSAATITPYGMRVQKSFKSITPFAPGRRPFFKYRDLGLEAATGGRMRAYQNSSIVGMTEATLSSFASGHRLTLPATSITALEWRVR